MKILEVVLGDGCECCLGSNGRFAAQGQKRSGECMLRPGLQCSMPAPDLCPLREGPYVLRAASSKPSDAVLEHAPSESTTGSKGASEGNLELWIKFPTEQREYVLGKSARDYSASDCICTETTYGKQCPVEDHMPPALMELKWTCDRCGEPWSTTANGQPVGKCECGCTSARFVYIDLEARVARTGSNDSQGR